MRYPVLALLLCAFASVAHADAIERFRSFLKTTQSARADFEQKVYARGDKLTQESKGSFVFQRPGLFRWTYAKPIDQVIVGDGERVWIYDRDLNQVTVRKMSKALGSTPAALLAGSSDVEKAFELTDAGTRDNLEWLQAKPRDAEAGFDHIRMGFSATGVQAMELVDNFGQTTRLRFLNLQRNPKTDPADFRFEPPKGADVLGEK
ncbi:MAG TPA: outer membrane lipoprotein chaperone LolA [Burkholderiales bacterium]|jgi:outer membrane lipoprotein carrier protein